MRIKNRPVSYQVQAECNLVMPTVEAEGECRDIGGNTDTLLGVTQNAGKQGKQMLQSSWVFQIFET